MKLRTVVAALFALAAAETSAQTTFGSDIVYLRCTPDKQYTGLVPVDYVLDLKKREFFLALMPNIKGHPLLESGPTLYIEVKVDDVEGLYIGFNRYTLRYTYRGKMAVPSSHEGQCVKLDRQL